MNDTDCVRARDGLADLEHHSGGLQDRHLPFFPQDPREIAADEVLHHDERRAALGRGRVQHADDVLALDLRDRARLAGEALGMHLVARGLRPEHLDRDKLVQALVPRGDDEAHAAGADHALDDVISDAIAHRERRTAEVELTRLLHAGKHVRRLRLMRRRQLFRRRRALDDGHRLARLRHERSERLRHQSRWRLEGIERGAGDRSGRPKRRFLVRVRHVGQDSILFSETMMKIHETGAATVHLDADEDGAIAVVLADGRFALPAGAIAAVMKRYGAPLDAAETLVDVASLPVDGEVLRHVRHKEIWDVIARDYLVLGDLCVLATHVAGALEHLGRANRMS